MTSKAIYGTAERKNINPETLQSLSEVGFDLFGKAIFHIDPLLLKVAHDKILELLDNGTPDNEIVSTTLLELDKVETNLTPDLDWVSEVAFHQMYVKGSEHYDEDDCRDAIHTMARFIACLANQECVEPFLCEDCALPMRKAA